MIKKILLLIISVICIFGIVQMKSVKAIEIGENVYLERGEKGFFSIQKWNGSQWIYVIHSITNYVDETGKQRVAYCVSPDLTGIGYVDGEFEGYEVNAKELLNDERLWRVYINGYPYKSAQELGVEYDEDAYLATKQAGFCIIRGYSVEDIRNLFRAGQDPVAGQSLDDIQRRGQKIIDAMCHLVDIGYNGSQRKADENSIKVEKVGDIIKDESCIFQEYKIDSNVEGFEYKIKGLKGFPEGSYVSDVVNGKFKIMIPKEVIKECIEGTIIIEYKQKDYPVLYTECTSGNYQNYILCTDEYSYNKELSFKFDVDSFKSKIKILKVDKDSKNPISGVKFSVKYKDNQKEIGIFETDENGTIIIDKIRPGQIEIKELESNSDYVVSDESITVDIEYNEEKEIQIENELKKASIKIIKVDSNNNEIRIPDVKFELTNSRGEVVGMLTTDKNGETEITGLPINEEYTIREIETNEKYELSNESVTIKLNENEIKTLTFKNKLKETTGKLPRTGQIDKKEYLSLISIISVVIMLSIRKKI